MERTIARVRDDVASGGVTRGAQVVVMHHGEPVLELATGDDGLRRAVSPETVFRVYCSIKPIVAVAIADAVDAGLLGLDEPLETHLPDMAALWGGVTARHVLTHTAGLQHPTAPQMEVIAPDKRRPFLERMMRPPTWRLGVDAAFSEYSGWYVLGWLLEALTGEPLREHLRATVLDPLDLRDTWIGMTETQHGAIEGRLGVSHDLRGPKPMPMLLEPGLRWCTETNPAHGGYSTATDLARFYDAILQRLTRNSEASPLPAPELLRTFCSTARPAVHDQTLGRICPFGLGFMTSLSEHAFSDACGAATFGHSGYVGSSLAFADPDHDLAVAIIYNGVVSPEVITARRSALIASVYADLRLRVARV